MGSSRAEAERRGLGRQIQDRFWNKGGQDELRDWTPSWGVGGGRRVGSKDDLSHPPPDHPASPQTKGKTVLSATPASAIRDSLGA